MAQLRMYAYNKCGTCKKAARWLENRGISVKVIPIVDEPPTPRQLARIRNLAGVETRKLFNTAGQSYREGGWKEKISGVSDKEALEALSADGKLIKRPLVVGQDFALIGFKEAEYEGHLGG